MNCIKYESEDLIGKLKPRGRTWKEKAALCFDFSGSGFELCFVGTKVVLHTAVTGTSGAYIVALLDGMRYKFFIDGTCASVIDDLNDGEHTLHVIKATEGNAAVKLLGVEIGGSKPQLTAAPAPGTVKMLFVGDSISCGYGTEADESTAEFHLYEQDVTHAYSWNTARAFGADEQIVAISGQGIVKNCNGETGTPIPCFFEYASRTEAMGYDHSGFVPDVTVINAGTNDGFGKVEAEEFCAGASHFLDRVRELYPHTIIIWAYGMMASVYRDTLHELIGRRAQQDKDLYFLPLPLIYDMKDGRSIGANGHPTTYSQLKCGTEPLVELVGKITGWRHDTV